MGASAVSNADLAFQSTPPRGRATRLSQTSQPWERGFNPRPPRGRRLGRCFEVRVGHVSIHASAREATNRADRPRSNSSCGFNPRLRAGGDEGNNVSLSAVPSFNPRLRAGGDLAWRSYL